MKLCNTTQKGQHCKQTLTNIPNVQATLLNLERKGRSKATIRNTRIMLTVLARKADLNNIQEVETIIARMTVCNRTKAYYCTAYNSYCRYLKIPWEMPIYRTEPHGIQPPTNERIQMLITSARYEMSIKLNIIAETGLRPVEIVGTKGLKPTDIHPDTNTIIATSTKGCNARPPMKVSLELTMKLQTYILHKQCKTNEPIFKCQPETFTGHFIRFKKHLAKKLCDPSILTIRLYDIRHAYVTNKLRKIGNAEIVRQIMGHKRLDTTQKYFHLLPEDSHEWIVESTNDQKRADELLKQDFTYILTTPDGYMKFRKPK